MRLRSYKHGYFTLSHDYPVTVPSLATLSHDTSYLPVYLHYLLTYILNNLLT